eukprot:6513868-Prymnesium_polylepis.1
MPGMRRACGRQGAARRHTWRERQQREERALKHRPPGGQTRTRINPFPFPVRGRLRGDQGLA